MEEFSMNQGYSTPNNQQTNNYNNNNNNNNHNNHNSNNSFNSNQSNNNNNNLNTNNNQHTTSNNNLNTNNNQQAHNTNQDQQTHNSNNNNNNQNVSNNQQNSQNIQFNHNTQSQSSQQSFSNSLKPSVADAELEELLSLQRAKIKVIGAGGGGNNTINRITEVGIKGSETIAINTDAQDLLYTTADKKILIGREVTNGMGAGSDPKIGEESARENEHELKKSIEGADMVFITCGMGGGTGTGSAPVIAEIAKKAGALTVGVVTVPFTMEGNRRYENAIIGLERLERVLDTLIVIPNDKLLELAPDLPLHTAFKVADEILTNAVKGIAEMVTRAGLVNLDFADIKSVMSNGGVALIGVGESDSDNRAIESVEKAINNPLLDVDITGATGALINISGSKDLTLNEARKVVEALSQRLNENAKIIWGAQIYEDMGGMLRTMLIVTGVRSPQIFGNSKRMSENERDEIENELGIEFVN